MSYAGTIIPAPISNPFEGIVDADPFLTITYRQHLSDVYVTYENIRSIFQMFTFKPLVSGGAEHKEQVYVQFLKPAPARWFNLSLFGMLDEFKAYQKTFTTTKGELSFKDLLGLGLQPASETSSLKRTRIADASPSPRRGGKKRTDKRTPALAAKFLEKGCADTSISVQDEDGLLLKQQETDVLRIKSVDATTFRVKFAQLDFELFFIDIDTCIECLRQLKNRTD